MTHGDKSETAHSDLQVAVFRLSNAAFGLAKELVAGSGDAAQRQEQARAMNEQLDALWPRIQALPPIDQAPLATAWGDARLDLGYILSGGELSPSNRLAAHISSVQPGS
jgi:hypothetical protein